MLLSLGLWNTAFAAQQASTQAQPPAAPASGARKHPVKMAKKKAVPDPPPAPAPLDSIREMYLAGVNGDRFIVRSGMTTRIGRALDLAGPLPCAIDAIVYTSAEIAHQRHSKFLQRIFAEGIVAYECRQAS